MRFIQILKIVYALLRIPQLFISLILFPLLLSLVLVGVQFVVSGIVVSSNTMDSSSFEEASTYWNEKSFVRLLIYGSYDPLPPLKICRWIEIDGREIPPGEDCAPDRLDVAIRTESPALQDVSAFVPLFDGSFERLHVCATCKPDIIVTPGIGTAGTTETKSVFALALLRMAKYNTNVVEGYVKAVKNFDAVHSTLGNIKLSFPGFRAPVPISNAPKYIGIILNIAGMIIISLWLAVKAHRRVLEYFAKSGALMPLVVATGSGTFYSALWVLTFIRVAAFLFAVLPVTIFSLTQIAATLPGNGIFDNSFTEFAIWLLTLSCSFGLATLLASVADLKSRHTFIGWVYRYFPLTVCAVGAGLWAFLFLFEEAYLVRDVISSLPIAGSLPILLAPVFQPRLDVLCLHFVLSGLLIALVMRYNTRWFAAHLEEL